MSMVFRVGFTILIAFLSITSATGVTIRVKQGAIGAGNGQSWTDAFTRVEDAIMASHAGDQIWVAQGRYTPEFATDKSYHVPAGVALFGGFEGVENTLDERAANPAEQLTVLDGDLLGDDVGFKNRSDNSAHVIVLKDADSSTIIDGFTIQGGEATDLGGKSRGGAITSSGDAIFRNLNITANQAVNGGGIYSLNGTPIVTNCQFIGNQALEISGALMFEENPSVQNAEFSLVEGCHFLNNSAGAEGGAMAIQQSFPAIKSCRFEGNSSPIGGALRLQFASLDLIECDFIGNTSMSGGAILFYRSSGQVLLSRFVGNSSENGSGACGLSDSNLTFANCLFSGNSAVNQGGAMIASGSGLHLVNCTLANNSAASGGGLLLEAKVGHLIQNCIIWGNSASGFPSEIDWFHSDYPKPGEIPTRFLNLSGESGGLLVRGGLPNRDDVILDSPNFVDEVGADGIVGTEDDNYRTGSVSPAHGTGLLGVLLADDYDLDNDGDIVESIPFDLAGSDRLVGSKFDLGAFEALTPSIYFPDVRFPSVPENPVTLSGWAQIDSNTPQIFSTMVTETEGSLSFESPVSISPTGNLEFEISSGTSGWAKIEVSVVQEGDQQVVGDFHIFVCPVVHFVDGNRKISGNGTSWEEAFAGLSDALGLAMEGDEIRLTQAIYHAAGAPDESATFRLKQGVKIRGGFSGNETDRDPSDSSARSTLSGDFSTGFNSNKRAFNVVTAERVDETTLLESLTITGGYGNSNSGSGRGGGIFCTKASPTLRRVAIVDNSVQGSGGGLYLTSSDCLLDRCFIGGNWASGTGGGLFIGSSSTIRIVNTIFSGNWAVENGGGIASVNSNSELILVNSTLTRNFSSRGIGGIHSGNFKVRAHNSIIYGNVGSDRSDLEASKAAFVDEGFSANIIRGKFSSVPSEQVIDAAPLFVNPAGSDGVVGTLDDDLRLLRSSPALDAGVQNALSSEFSKDFLDQPRITGAGIDIGAIEGSLPATFALLHPGLDPGGDANHDGLSNFVEYAVGNNPRQLRPSGLGLQSTQDILGYRVRNNAADVSTTLQKSVDLNSWTDLVEGEDFSLESSVISDGGIDLYMLELSDSIPETMFFRQIFKLKP